MGQIAVYLTVIAAPQPTLVIARSEATWQSPGIIHDSAQQKQTLYREIATPVCALARNDSGSG